ncbi:hypothetical protein N4T20_08935 [Flavobacterium sp. TR2]|uniref:hypothetical protein n=1 Tax=Flavobacterium sp. TR2 TaxID=2977321 RepID=UPI0021B14F28|nr:hypothetical protein [Flavobacterium sp. TR2]UWY30054.1 hypothetical protein N4T20_08935 [Flavobacterium sp. TR2]
MQKKLLSFFLIVISFCQAQERINDKLPVITKKNEALILANGWYKSEAGQWISGKNKIPQDLGENQKLLGNYEAYGLGSDNFISLEIKDVTIADSTYAVLIKKYRDGFYTYSSIQKGWNNKISCKYYVFSKGELNKIKEIENDNLNKILFKIIYEGNLLFINTKTFNNTTISKDILSKINDKTYLDHQSLVSHHLGLNLYYFKAKNIVQFYFYDANLYFDDSLYEDSEETKAKTYYETDAISFKKFLNF